MKYIFSFFSLCIFTACGGGSEQPSSLSSQNPIQPITSQEELFTANVVLNDNSCGKTFTVPAVEAELFIHDENWEIVSRHNPDENGTFSVEYNGETANVSILKKGTSSDETDVLIYSIADAPLGDLGVFEFSESGLNTSPCGCENIDITLNSVGPTYFHSVGVYVGDSFFATEKQGYYPEQNNSVSLRNVYVCSDSNGDWPMVRTYAYFYDDPNEYVGVLRDYDPLSNQESSVDLSMVLSDLTVNVSGDYTNISTYTLDSKGEESFKRSYSTAETPKVLKGVPEFPLFAVEASTVELLDRDDMVGAVTTSAKLTNISDSISDVSLDAPNFNDFKIAAENFSFNFYRQYYDFSQFSSLTAVDIYRTQYYEHYDNSRVEIIHFHTGDLNGLIPSIELPEEYGVDLTASTLDDVQLRIRVVGYQEKLAYSDFIKKTAERSRLLGIEKYEGYWSEYYELESHFFP